MLKITLKSYIKIWKKRHFQHFLAPPPLQRYLLGKIKFTVQNKNCERLFFDDLYISNGKNTFFRVFPVLQACAKNVFSGRFFLLKFYDVKEEAEQDDDDDDDVKDEAGYNSPRYRE